MIRTVRVLATAAAFAVVFSVASPMAEAASVAKARPTQINEANAAVGDRWQQLLPTGQLVTMEKVDRVSVKTVTPLNTAPAATSCPGYPYLCAWSTDTQQGTLWIYNMNNVYSNTANGVAHCWNMAADANNHTKSWYNDSNRSAYLNNWVNCHQNGEQFLIEFYATGSSSHHDSDCHQESTPGRNWCTTLFPTSILATA